MAGYIRCLYKGALTPYALVKNPNTNQVANLVSSSWVTYSSGSRSNYKFTLVREAGTTDSWYVQVPDWISDSLPHFTVEIYARVALNVADSDPGLSVWQQQSSSILKQIVNSVLDEFLFTHTTVGTVGGYLQTSATGNLTAGDVDAVAEKVLSADLAALIDQSLPVPKHSLASLILQHQSYEITDDQLAVLDPNSGDPLQTYSITFGAVCPAKAVS